MRSPSLQSPPRRFPGILIFAYLSHATFLLLDKDKYKMHFLNDDFIKVKNPFQPTWKSNGPLTFITGCASLGISIRFKSGLAPKPSSSFFWAIKRWTCWELLGQCPAAEHTCSWAWGHNLMAVIHLQYFLIEGRIHSSINYGRRPRSWSCIAAPTITRPPPCVTVGMSLRNGFVILPGLMHVNCFVSHPFVCSFKIVAGCFPFWDLLAYLTLWERFWSFDSAGLAVISPVT